MRFQILEESLELALHGIHFFAHVENDLDTCEVNAKVAGQREDELETFQIGIFIKARITDRPGRLQQSLAFIQTQRLRMDVVKLRDSADRVSFDLSFHHTKEARIQKAHGETLSIYQSQIPNPNSQIN